MHLSREIEIAAPPSTVWDVTTDVTRWPEWTPTVKAVEWLEGSAVEVGSVARLEQPSIPPALWTVTDVDQGRRFAWRTKNLGANFIGTHTVEETPGGTRAAMMLDVSGIGGILMWPVLSLALRRVLRQEAEGLKARCEERTRAVS